MSLRCYIRSFDLAKMRSLFGSRDEAAYEDAARAVRKVFDWAGDEDEDEEEEEEAELILAICRRAIFDGVPFEGLAWENGNYGHAAAILAAIGQTHRSTSFESWMVMRIFPPFLRDHAASLPAPARQLLTYLAEGRPVFSPRVEPDWSHVAYLSLDEVKELHAALIQLQDQRPELKGEGYLDGFVDALVQGLNEVIARKKDLWLEAG